MRRKHWIPLVAAALAVVGIVGYVVAKKYFLPEDSTRVNEAAPEHAEILKEGTFHGNKGHSVSGAAKILRVGTEYFLRFEHYNQTAGPDVYVYLTPSADPDGQAEIDEGLKVYIDGGADGGESTKVGTFNQRLPPDFDPGKYHGVAVWCDRFSVSFGAAALHAA